MNSTDCKVKLEKHFYGHDLKRSDALRISNCIRELEQENAALKNKIANFQGAITAIFDISKGYSSACGEIERSIAQLETVSGYSISKLIDMFKQGYTLEYPEDTFREQMQLIALKHEIEEMRKVKEKLYR